MAALITRNPRPRSFARAVLLSSLLFLAGGCAGSGTGIEGCLRWEATDDLNVYNGQAHIVTLHLFPLGSTAGFQSVSPDDLLSGAMPGGVLGPPGRTRAAPGQEGEFEGLFPVGTNQLGVVADYYREPGDAEGTRKQIVPVRCGWRTPRVQLSDKNLHLR